MCPHENCERTYVKKSNLNSHLKTHTDQRFTCEVDGCDKQFKHKISLRNHRKKAHKLPDDLSASERNEKSIKSKKASLTMKRVSMARSISGFAADHDDVKHLLRDDKQFRQSVLTRTHDSPPTRVNC
jgi:hypothetical protein